MIGRLIMEEEKVVDDLCKEEIVERKDFVVEAEDQIPGSSSQKNSDDQDQAGKELFRSKIVLCEKNKLLRSTIECMREERSELEEQLIYATEQCEKIENDRIYFLNFISDLKGENEALQVSNIYIYIYRPMSRLS